MNTYALRFGWVVFFLTGAWSCAGDEANGRPGTDAADRDESSMIDAVDDPGAPPADQREPDVPADVPIAPTCLSGTLCASQSDCAGGERCNATLVPPACQKLYCSGLGQSCDPAAGDTLCQTGLFCVSTNPPQCLDCKPDCAGKACGADGCGGSCGACAEGRTCSAAGACVVNLTWIDLQGGTFQMGSNDGSSDEQPVHAVTLSAFQVAKNEVTQEQYEGCTAWACTTPEFEWYPAGMANRPVVCVDWSAAKAFCEWAGARLCTEAEWEYAARSGGKDQTYAWGDAAATCDCAVMDDGSGAGCGTEGTWEVCGKAAGNSAQGACDFAGNVWEWVADWYGGYPSDAQTNPTGPVSGSFRVIRGGGYYGDDAYYLRAAGRGYGDPDVPGVSGFNLGFRCCRSN